MRYQKGLDPVQVASALALKVGPSRSAIRC
jgi:hypothetical protein